MNKIARFTTLISATALLALGSAVAEADIISIVGVPIAGGTDGGPRLTITSNRISISDFFDRFDETRWEITSAVEDANGGVAVTYNYPVRGQWDSYGGLVDLEFQILPDDGKLTPEQVTVDIWGSSFYRHELHRACCFSDAPEVQIFGNREEPRYSTTNGAYTIFDQPHVMLTNTTYILTYFNSQYVEGTPSGSDLPFYFATHQQYDAFVAARGMSGSISASAFGFFDFNLGVRQTSVPEPGSLALLGIGLAGLFLARRRAPPRS